eukprot:scaffold8110_cov267-Pinguiococcus_pyrenoidosus.AAC.9
MRFAPVEDGGFRSSILGDIALSGSSNTLVREGPADVRRTLHCAAREWHKKRLESHQTSRPRQPHVRVVQRKR